MFLVCLPFCVYKKQHGGVFFGFLLSFLAYLGAFSGFSFAEDITEVRWSLVLFGTRECFCFEFSELLVPLGSFFFFIPLYLLYLCKLFSSSLNFWYPSGPFLYLCTLCTSVYFYSFLYSVLCTYLYFFLLYNFVPFWVSKILI